MEAPMIENGFDVRREHDGTWSVFDKFSSEVVSIEGHVQARLTETEARDALDLLIRKYMVRHHEDGSGRLP
ncbi:hypothetical protein FIC94_01425 [Ochrobactrum teleogrylli]|uniref:Uncharacterized protein n=2 Tax=Ochrobactrum teleogrylli TaxID=2479765 RepID=A0ABY2Y8P5_9HYPH|nr:hypothetical protein FIC94_01425 [[Ochrobactrum] teleogrylli]